MICGMITKWYSYKRTDVWWDSLVRVNYKVESLVSSSSILTSEICSRQKWSSLALIKLCIRNHLHIQVFPEKANSENIYQSADWEWKISIPHGCGVTGMGDSLSSNDQRGLKVTRKIHPLIHGSGFATGFPWYLKLVAAFPWFFWPTLVNPGQNQSVKGVVS